MPGSDRRGGSRSTGLHVSDATSSRFDGARTCSHSSLLCSFGTSGKKSRSMMASSCSAHSSSSSTSCLGFGGSFRAPRGFGGGMSSLPVDGSDIAMLFGSQVERQRTVTSLNDDTWLPGSDLMCSCQWQGYIIFTAFVSVEQLLSRHKLATDALKRKLPIFAENGGIFQSLHHVVPSLHRASMKHALEAARNYLLFRNAHNHCTLSNLLKVNREPGSSARVDGVLNGESSLGTVEVRLPPGQYGVRQDAQPQGGGHGPIRSPVHEHKCCKGPAGRHEDQPRSQRHD